MPARAPQFRQRDVTRAIKAAAKAGMPVSRCEIDPSTGKIVIYAGEPGSATADPYADWKAKRDARRAEGRP